MTARKCTKCVRGEVHSFKHGTLHSFQYHDCRCIDCKFGARTQVARWRAANPEKQLGTHRTPESRHDYYRRNAAQYKRHHEKYLQKFARVAGDTPRKAWTPEEDAVVLRSDLTQLEMAYLLGRNRGSILYRRGRLRQEQAA